VSNDVGFRTLGPIEIVAGGEPVRVAPGRQTVILGALLLEANRVVSIDQLIDAVWEERPPTTARSQIQICVSALRQLFTKLGVDCPIVTAPPGYLLKVADGQLDMQSFAQGVAEAERVAGEGRLAEAADLLRQVLTLWRGPALGGESSTLLRNKAIRLDEDRLQALETCFDLELRLGRHRQLVGELGGVVQEYPLRERLRGQYMLALYRSGRSADALETYRLGRRILVDELGLEPGEELRRLESAILAEDGELALVARPQSTVTGVTAVPVVAPHQLPADIVDFTGRERLVAEAEAVLANRAEDGWADRAVPVVLIAGKAGIGKTALAVHVAHKLHRDGFPDGQLFCNLAGTQREPVAPSDVLARFLRALGVPGASIPDTVDERADMYRSLLAAKRVLVVLDDVATESQVVPLLPGSGSCAVLVTSRARLTGIPGGRLLDVGVLGAEQALAMLASVVGAERVAREPAAADALVRVVGGLPLALRIVAARLAARPHWSLASMLGRLADERRRLDELTHGDMMMRASLSLTYDGLQPAAARLFRLLGVVAAESVPSWLAAALLDEDPVESASLLELLVDTQLLDVAGLDLNAEPRYAFHDIIRLFAGERLARSEDESARRQALVRVLGGWLSLVESAHRKVYGGDFTVLRGNSPRWTPPAEVTAVAVADPLRWLDAERPNLCAAVGQAADAGLHEQAWELAVYLVTLFEAFSYFDDWQATHDRALEAVRAAANRRGEAALLCSLGSLHVSRRRLAAAHAVLHPALSLFKTIGDDYGVATVQRNLALLYDNEGETEAASTAYQRAADGFRRFGDPVGQAYVIAQIAQIELNQGKTPSAIDRLRDALEACRDVDSPRVEAMVLLRLGEAMVQQRQYDEAHLIMSTVLEMVRRFRDSVGESHALRVLGVIAGRLGRHAEAEELLLSAVAIREQALDQAGAARINLDLARLLADRGRTADAIDLVERAVKTFDERRMQIWQTRARDLLDSMTGGASASGGDGVSDEDGAPGPDGAVPGAVAGLTTGAAPDGAGGDAPR
jgi:DNA-binding SARP family transcriptional activator/tetratricopeptide (TPR) repeat protein